MALTAFVFNGTNAPMNTSTLNVRKFPDDLRQLLKVKAVTRGMTLQALVIELLRAATKAGK
jgi:plasmid stability protein